MSVSVSLDPRSAILDYAFKHIWKPYYYGGDGPSEFDCSGFVIAVLQMVACWPQGKDARAQGLYDRFKRTTVEEPYKGCLAFYGKPDNINHVVICINKLAIIGANGRDIRRVSVENIDYRIKKYNLHDLVAYCDPLPGVA
jgi:cell wall-associated NlpC family hydrolase